MKLLGMAALCALLSFVAGTDSGVVHYVRGLEVQPGGRDLADTAWSGSIAFDLQSIAKDGVTSENGENLIKNIQQAMKVGQLAATDGPGLVNSIRKVIKSGANAKDGTAIRV
ncbi:hypothetical protein SDRG_13957 [Saprolegnia diclina VS20]|uniref:Uncharacterized protein n=1 Tax=Saprolegnia diclina (strain VS20) TaxID=1156394 RepID=T0Q133_SAPDV|nr:hypothetical protein SDRG_13957 [Saprolegnia diclina VS20]EQC28276.1 hypothetical protein SDRG_13957 [Saprolegnia diclina VS20]|eukprot:XP_008618280.1 hypothetical protein SDRG_13957 [Saprolegnia diclina VS20]